MISIRERVILFVILSEAKNLILLLNFSPKVFWFIIYIIMLHTLKSALREDTPTVLSSADLRTASEVIWSSGRGFVIILEGEVPVGILTERDLSKAIAQNISLDTPV